MLEDQIFRKGKTVRIIYFHQYFNTIDMIGGTRSFEMARRLVSNGHEVHIITSWRENGSGPIFFETKEEGINVHWIRVNYSNKFRFFRRVVAFLKYAFLSAYKAKFIDADIVLATSTPLTIALPGIYTAWRKMIPMVFEVRDLWPELPIAMGVLKNPFTRFLAKRLELFAYKNSDSIITLSPGMKDGVVSTGYSAVNVSVIPNGADLELFSIPRNPPCNLKLRYKIPRDAPLLVYTGAFGVINGLRYMVDLACELMVLNSNVCILLIGDGAEFDAVIDMSKASGVLNKNIFIEKALPKKEIPHVLSSSTMASVIFIDLPEMRANSANKFFDALAAGKPVFVNFGGWIRELVIQHNCGLAMWNKTMPEIAKELNFCINNQQWLDNAGVSARRLACEYFNRDVLASQFEKVLLSTYEGKPNLSSSIAPGVYN